MTVPVPFQKMPNLASRNRGILACHDVRVGIVLIIGELIKFVVFLVVVVKVELLVVRGVSGSEPVRISIELIIGIDFVLGVIGTIVILSYRDGMSVNVCAILYPMLFDLLVCWDPVCS